MSFPPLLDLDGPTAPPRDNGELVFTAPWQTRTFGVTMALVGSGALAWEPFRAKLVAAVAVAGRTEGFDYWSCWEHALEQALAAGGLLAPDDLERRVRALSERPTGHDHREGQPPGHTH